MGSKFEINKLFIILKLYMKVHKNDIKIFIVGECVVGKTNLTKVYLGKDFDPREPSHCIPYENNFISFY